MASQYVDLPIATAFPEGPAGGDLTGSYPNPSLANTDTARADLGVFTKSPPFTTVTSGQSPYTVLSSDAVLAVDTSGGAVTLQFPNPTLGAAFVILDVTGSFSSNNCTLSPFSSEKIEGVAASKALQTAWGGWRVLTNKTDWFLL